MHPRDPLPAAHTEEGDRRAPGTKNSADYNLLLNLEMKLKTEGSVHKITCKWRIHDPHTHVFDLQVAYLFFPNPPLMGLCEPASFVHPSPFKLKLNSMVLLHGPAPPVGPPVVRAKAEIKKARICSRRDKTLNF
jgi:hypothetical protein